MSWRLTRVRELDRNYVTIGGLVTGILVLFWASAAVDSSGAVVSGARAAAAVTFTVFVPGALLTHLLGFRLEDPWQYGLLAVALSTSVLSALSVALAVVLPALGYPAPISFFPIALALTVVVAVSLVLFVTGTGVCPSLRFELLGPPRTLVALAGLPLLAVGAAALVNRFGSTAGMYLFVAAIGLTVVLTTTRYIAPEAYPATVFFAGLATLLHRNLLSDGVIGADIQGLYFVTRLIGETGQWGPQLGGTPMAVPMVSVVPAVVSTLSGLTVAATFKVVYVLVFAFVPLAVYYLARPTFGEEAALYGSLFFLFYHVTFSFTPGKQLVAELFAVVLLLFVFRRGLDGLGSKLAVVVLAAGLIHSHYGVTYVLGGALLLTAIGFTAARPLLGGRTRMVPLWFPVVLLVAASAWYSYASPELFALIAGIPFQVADQVRALALYGAVPGSGASYVSEQTTLVDQLNLALYVLLTALVGLGLAWRGGSQLRTAWRTGTIGDLEYTAVAGLIFVFLGSSYFLVFNLWADRVYQLSLIVLAPFMPLGYRALTESTGRFRDWSSPHWSVVASLLVVLLAFNSGLVASVAGTAHTSAFNPDAHDLAFSSEERAGAAWLRTHADVERLPAYQDNAADTSDDVRIYTDSVTAQMFRAEIPPGYTNAEVLLLKSQQRPTLDVDRLQSGYVFIRRNAVLDQPRGTSIPTARLSGEEVRAIRSAGDTVFANEAVVIVEIRREDETTGEPS